MWILAPVHNAHAFQGPVDYCASDLVVVGRSLSRTSELVTEPSGIRHVSSRVDFDVEIVVQGTVPSNPLRLNTWAGTVLTPEGFELSVSVTNFPDLAPGERYLLFLNLDQGRHPYPIYVGFQELDPDAASVGPVVFDLKKSVQPPSRALPSEPPETDLPPEAELVNAWKSFCG